MLKTVLAICLLLSGMLPTGVWGADTPAVDSLMTAAPATGLIQEARRRAEAAERLWRKNQRSSSYRQAKRAIELDPNNVQALYWGGRYAAREMMRTLERETPGTASTFNFEEYGGEMRDRAIGYLTRLLRIDPDHRPGRLLLGLVYYEARMADRLVDLFEDYLKRHPEDRDAYFFIGLGYQAKEDLHAAYSAYTEGLDRMSGVEQQFMKSIFMLTDEKALERDETLPDEETLRRFWTGRDPLFLTPVNERLMEHCRRVAYANLRFGEPLKGIEGWTTDMGQAYIRYGQPTARTLSLGEVYLLEVWRYPGFTLRFGNTLPPDRWRILNAWLEGIPMGSFGALIERIPEYYGNPYWWEHYDAHHQTAQFRGTDGKTRVEVYYALPGEEVRHQKAGSGIQEVDVKRGLFLFDAVWDTVRQEISRVRRMPWVVYNAARQGYLFGAEQLALEPGAYHLVVEAEDRAGKTVGSFRDALRVRRFGTDTLEVSELLLARRIVEREDRPFGRERFMVLPNPLKRCSRDGNISFYFEVYNLERDDFGATHYRVTYQTRVLPEERAVGEVAPEWTTAVSHTLRGTRAWEPVRVTLDMEGSAPGPRAFRVVVEDLQGQRQAVASTRFRVMW